MPLALCPLRWGAPLKEAQDLAKQHRFKEALDKVNQAEAVSGKTAFETYTILKFKLYLYTQLKDYANAAKAAEAVLTTGLSSAEEAKQYKHDIAVFYFCGKTKAPRVSPPPRNTWRNTGSDDALLTQIANQAYRDRDYATSFDASEKLVRAAESAGQRPSESALSIYMGSAFYLHRQDVYVSSLEKLVAYFGKGEYWTKLLDNLPAAQGL